MVFSPALLFSPVGGAVGPSPVGLCHAVSEVHDLYFVLRAVTPVESNGWSCSCAAGKAVCNHVVALIFQTSP